MAQANPIDGAREHVLANGLKLLIKENHTAPLASVWCWCRVGSGDETRGLTNVSHYCEYMPFKGSTNLPRDQANGVAESCGGYWKDCPWIDMTMHVETVRRWLDSSRAANVVTLVSEAR
jgi:zinc protease